MEFDQRKVATLVGTLVVAGAVVAAGIYGPNIWKTLNPQTTSPQPVVQTPPVDATTPTQTDGTGNVTNPGNTANQGNSTNSGISQNSANSSKTNPTSATTSPNAINSTPQGDVSGPKKYTEPDLSQMDLAPSIAGYFSNDGSGLSNSVKDLMFQSAWNIHQYVDGYLFGVNAGPQMNEQDIKKYILFHKTLLDKQLKNESSAALTKAAPLVNYFDELLNRGMDAFDSKDKARIEQFHQEIHDLDAHLFRNDTSAKIYGATPFATKR